MTYSYSKENTHRKRRQCQGGGVMVWGFIMPNGLMAIKFVSNHFDSKEYIDVLQNFALPLVRLNFRSIKWVQDNSRVHTSKVTQEYMKKNNMDLIKWPAMSPDINIMESGWKMISDIVYTGSQPENISELKQKIVQAVKQINECKRDTVMHLYETMGQRIASILQKKGAIYNEK